jgi:hypothetical protein
MLWINLLLLLTMAVISLFATYSWIGGIIQIVLICTLAGFAIHRIWRMRAGQSLYDQQ